MRDLVLLTAGLVAVSPSARADLVDHTITAEIAGRCERLMVAGVSKPCPPDSAYLRWATRGRSIRVRLPDGQEAVFEAKRDGREGWQGPRDYRLPLGSVYFFGDAGARYGDAPVLGPMEGAHDVTGECRISMSPDGATWHRVECHASDAAGARYGLVLSGGGRITFLIRGRPVDSPFTPDAPRR